MGYWTTDLPVDSQIILNMTKEKVHPKTFDRATNLTFDVYLDNRIKLFFTLTELCRNKDTESPYDQANLSQPAFTDSECCFVAEGSKDVGTSLEYWIAKEVER